MKLLLAIGCALFVQLSIADAAHRLPLSHRTASTMQGSVGEPSRRVGDHGWKFALLGLAGLGFLIRKRL